MQGSVPFRMMTSAMARSGDGGTFAIVRASSIYLWHAEAPGEITHVELPAQFASAPPSAPLGGGPRRQAPGGNEGSSPAYRSIQISPLCDRIYTTEQREAREVGRAAEVGDRVERGCDDAHGRASFWLSLCRTD